MKTKALFLGENPGVIERVFGKGRKEQIAELCDLYPTILSKKDLAGHASDLTRIEVIFSTWGMPRLEAEELAFLPSLQAVFYAAGSVQNFAPPLLENEILVVSSWAANAVPVAEFTLAQILLAGKNYWQNTSDCRDPALRRTGKVRGGPGNFGETVSLLGAGMIGRKVIELLRPFELNVLVFDPFLPPEQAEELGVTLVLLEQAFQRGYVVSNHLANLPTTRGLLTGAHFEFMRPSATFINTGRGATVDEDGLIRVLQKRPDLTALLDVTMPEPPAEQSPLYSLPNVHLTSHIAGSLGDEVVRMADYAIAEFKSWRDGRPLRYAVTQEMLKTMA